MNGNSSIETEGQLDYLYIYESDPGERKDINYGQIITIVTLLMLTTLAGFETASLTKFVSPDLIYALGCISFSAGGGLFLAILNNSKFKES